MPGTFFMLYTSCLNFQVHQVEDAETITISIKISSRQSLELQTEAKLSASNCPSIALFSSL